MGLILRQSFPLGRFHGTPWRVNPYDDPFGEWPPSPWRFVRAVVARWYQWRRESIDVPDLAELDALVRALCDSAYSFHVPPLALRGSPVRQYHPVEFGWLPPAKKNKPIPRMKCYGTSLVQDNYWCVPRGEAGVVWWFVDGECWTPQMVRVLEHCLKRLVYFGRAETFTVMERVEGPAPLRNCKPSDQPCSAASVRILVPQANATRADVERVTDDPLLENNTIPPGAKMMYADLPHTPAAMEQPVIFMPRSDCRLMQLAIGWNVAPEPRAVVRLTERYRSVVLRELLLIKTQGQRATWSTVSKLVRTSVADMFGKDADGIPLTQHNHTEFFAWWSGRAPTRLLIWRSGRSFDRDEQNAIWRAASRELSWAAAGQEADWKIRLIPLDEAVPPPPGFDNTLAKVWESVTPYVPPRHHLRGAKPRESESIASQIRRELGLRGVPGGDRVDTEAIGEAIWVSVHIPRQMTARRAFIGDRRGYRLRLSFPESVTGPIRLGHSSSFGLGLFRPA